MKKTHANEQIKSKIWLTISSTRDFFPTKTIVFSPCPMLSMNSVSMARFCFSTSSPSTNTTRWTTEWTAAKSSEPTKTVTGSFMYDEAKRRTPAGLKNKTKTFKPQSLIKKYVTYIKSWSTYFGLLKSFEKMFTRSRLSWPFGDQAWYRGGLSGSVVRIPYPAFGQPEICHQE